MGDYKFNSGGRMGGRRPGGGGGGGGYDRNGGGGDRNRNSFGGGGNDRGNNSNSNNHNSNNSNSNSGGQDDVPASGGGGGGGARARKYVDAGACLTLEMSRNFYIRSARSCVLKGDDDLIMMNPHRRYKRMLLQPSMMLSQPEMSIPTRYCHTVINKASSPVNVVRWTREGRWLLTGASSGEYTIWNSADYSFNRIITLREVAIRSMGWNQSGDHWLATGDNDGYLHFWDGSFRLLKELQPHTKAIRGVSFSPSSAKLVTCSDDCTVKIFDFARAEEERTLFGHGFDVKSVAWHPTKALVLSGGRDNACKLWNPKTGQCLRTLQHHKNTITTVVWNPVDDNWFATASRDKSIRLYDLRMLKDKESLHEVHGHDAEIWSLVWHPVHKELLSSGANDGSLCHWLVGGVSEPQLQATIPAAHEGSIFSLDWNPIGTMLASGSNDHTAKFWSRSKPPIENYRGYIRDIGEVDLLLKAGVETPISLQKATELREKNEPDAVIDHLAREIIPGLGRIGGEFALRQAGMPLGIPEITSSLQVFTGTEGDGPVAAERALNDVANVRIILGGVGNAPASKMAMMQNKSSASGQGGARNQGQLGPQKPQRRLDEIPGPRERGRIRQWKRESGFGFITPFNLNLPQGSLFCHATEIEPGYGRNGEPQLQEGEIVEFTAEQAENKKTGEIQWKARYVVSEQYLDNVEETARQNPRQQQHQQQQQSRNQDSSRQTQPTRSLPALSREQEDNLRMIVSRGDTPEVREILSRVGITFEQATAMLANSRTR